MEKIGQIFFTKFHKIGQLGDFFTQLSFIGQFIDIKGINSCADNIIITD